MNIVIDVEYDKVVKGISGVISSYKKRVISYWLLLALIIASIVFGVVTHRTLTIAVTVVCIVIFIIVIGIIYLKDIGLSYDNEVGVRLFDLKVNERLSLVKRFPAFLISYSSASSDNKASYFCENCPYLDKLFRNGSLVEFLWENRGTVYAIMSKDREKTYFYNTETGVLMFTKKCRCADQDAKSYECHVMLDCIELVDTEILGLKSLVKFS